MAVVGIFCGTITLFGCLYLKEAGWDLGWMFIGQNGNQLFFLIHLNLVFYGCTILLLQPAKFQPQAFVEVIYLPSVYLLYVLITKTIFQVKYNVTGLSSDEWINTTFGQYYRLFQTFNLNYPGIFWLCFFLSVIFV